MDRYKPRRSESEGRPGAQTSHKAIETVTNPDGTTKTNHTVGSCHSSPCRAHSLTSLNRVYHCNIPPSQSYMCRLNAQGL